MPAYFDTGFSVRQPTWHGLAKILDDYPGSWDAARKEAGLEWEPYEEAVYEVDELYPDGTAKVKLITDFKQVKHSGTGARLDIANETYNIISHEVMGEIFEAIMEQSDGQIRYETAGSLDKGKRVWALARLGDEVELPGDPSPLQPYMALLNSHNGSAALRVIATHVRIVCANTWHAADLDATKRGSAYSFKHTKNWRNRVEEAKQALSASHEHIDLMIAQAREMLQIKINKLQRKTFVDEFAKHRVIANTIGKTPHTKVELAARLEQPRVQAALAGTIDTLTTILASRTCEGINDTVWGLVQAAGEFADHYRDSESPDTLFSRTVLADKEPLKQAAVRLARHVVKTA